MSQTLRSRVASALSFAHLAGLGLGRPSAQAADEDDPDKKNKTSAEDDPDKKDQDRENGDSKNAAADDDKKQRDGESDEDYAKRMKAADEDDPEKDKKDTDAAAEDDDEEMRGKSEAASARRRERARCAAIFACRHAARNPVLAANLAFNTTMTRQEAIAVLRETPAASNDNGRSARNPDLGAGGDLAASSSKAIESRWDKHMKHVRGEK